MLRAAVSGQRFRQATAGALYGLLMAGWMYGFLVNNPSVRAEGIAQILVGLLQVAAGFVIGRWWAAAALPAMTVALALAAPIGMTGDTGISFWFGILISSPGIAGLVALGVYLRRIARIGR